MAILKKKSTFVHETNYTEKFQPYSLWTTLRHT